MDNDTWRRSSEMPNAATPAYIGRYQVVRELGRGAMGVVYLAQHPAMDHRLVAIKTFRAPDGDEAEYENALARLLAEADRAGSLDHPNIVKVYDVDDRGTPPYIVMEYVDGVTLDQMLSDESPDADLSMSVLRQAAEALDYAHAHGIIHRDIKPANLMLDTRNAVKITDFGIAKRAGAATNTTSRFMGTPEYMSPEQLDGRGDIDGRADQFALATIAYQLVTGRKPFEADTVTALSHLIANKNPIPPSQINRNLGRQVDAVIARALSKNRDRRYSTCAEFIDALELALVAPVRRSVPVWAPVTAAAVLLGGLLTVGWMNCWFGGDRCAAPVTTPLTVSPDSAVLQPGESQQFLASGSVRWSLTPESAGAIAPDGTYRAPAEIQSEQSVTLTAVSTDNESVRKSVEVKLMPGVRPAALPPPVGVRPASANVRPGETVQFTSSSPETVWTLTPKLGSISRTGLYRAPQTGAGQSVTVTATAPDGGGGEATVAIRAAEAARYSVEALARNTVIPHAASFRDDDERYGHLGIGELSCRVKLSGGAAAGQPLRVVWIVNNNELDHGDVTLARGQAVVAYGNFPRPGTYEVRLMSGSTVHAKTVFTIQRGS